MQKYNIVIALVLIFQIHNGGKNGGIPLAPVYSQYSVTEYDPSI